MHLLLTGVRDVLHNNRINCFEYLGFYFQIVVPASKVIKRTLENEHNWANVGFFFLTLSKV